LFIGLVATTALFVHLVTFDLIRAALFSVSGISVILGNGIQLMSLDDMNISITDLKLPPGTLDHLSTVELETMAEAGNRILECCRVLKKNDATIVGEVLKGQVKCTTGTTIPSTTIIPILRKTVPINSARNMAISIPS